VSDGRFGVSTGAYFPDTPGVAALTERARAERRPYVELFAARLPELAELGAFLASAPETLEAFARVSVHAPIDSVDVSLLPAGFDTVLHPDLYPDATLLGRHAVFENMDAAKSFGRTRDDLATVFGRHPEAGFCLDVAHVWTNDPTLALGHELLDAFGDRLRQLHVSGIEPDCRHRETTAADLALYEPLLARCGHVPWILEALLA
jgi:hypothetical protein